MDFADWFVLGICAGAVWLWLRSVPRRHDAVDELIEQQRDRARVTTRDC